MSSTTVGVYDRERTSALLSRIEHATQQGDLLVDIDKETLQGMGNVGGRELRSPEDVSEWLQAQGFERPIAEFYADSVRRGLHVVVFQAPRDDEHFERVTREMREAEPEELQRELERWARGEQVTVPVVEGA